MILAFFALVGTLFSQTVLIASENTSYKKKLVQALTEELKEEGFAVETVNLQNGELEGVDPSSFAAVVISNSGVNKRVRPQVTAWLESIVGNDDNVIVHTTKRDEWDEALRSLCDSMYAFPVEVLPMRACIRWAHISSSLWCRYPFVVSSWMRASVVMRASEAAIARPSCARDMSQHHASLTRIMRTKWIMHEDCSPRMWQVISREVHSLLLMYSAMTRRDPSTVSLMDLLT